MHIIKTCFINLFYLACSLLFRHSLAFYKASMFFYRLSRWRKDFVAGFPLYSLQTAKWQQCLFNSGYSLRAKIPLPYFSFLFHHISRMYQDAWQLKNLKGIYSFHFWMNATVLLISITGTICITDTLLKGSHWRRHGNDYSHTLQIWIKSRNYL